MEQLPLVHILDLAAEGWIKPHVDSIRVLLKFFYFKILYSFILILYIIFFNDLYIVLWEHYCGIKFAERQCNETNDGRTRERIY